MKFGGATLSSEVAYAERTTSLSNQANTAYADSGLVLPTFTVQPGTIIQVELFWPVVLQGTADKNIFAAITKDDNTVVAEGQYTAPAAFGAAHMRVILPRLTSGTHALKARHRVDAGSALLGPGQAGAPAFIRAIRL